MNENTIPTFERFTTTNSVVMLVDHQTMTIDWVKSLPKIHDHCRMPRARADGARLRDAAGADDDDGAVRRADHSRRSANWPPTPSPRRYKRGGELSCWDAEDLRAGVAAYGRPNIVLAGLTTDICLFWAAVDAQRLGYKVMVIADACGTMTALGDQFTYERLRGLGITVTVVNQVVTELVGNFGTPEGQKAQKILGDEIISKLGQG